MTATSVRHAATCRDGRRGAVLALSLILLSALVLGMFATVFVPQVARADELTDQRAQLRQQLAQTRNDLSESSSALSAAGVAVDQAQSSLDRARFRLAQTQAELATARAKDQAMAKKLKQAKAELAAARAAVVAGQARLDAQLALAGEMVRDQYQQQSNLLPIAVLVSTESTVDLQTRLQWSTTLFDTAQAEIDDLTVIQTQLTAAKAKQAALKKQVAADRRAAAAALKTTRALEARAATEAAQVARLVQQRRASERAAADHVARDKARYAKLTRERASVEQRIAARIAKAKAQAKARAAARARAAAAARRASKAARSAAKAQRTSPRTSPRTARRSTGGGSDGGSGGGSTSGGSHGFASPVSASITSRYGMRFHPVLKYWKLHDGTDFGAGCGTAIRAPRSGRVAEKYYNTGYGNRLMIDHGTIDGRYVTTGFNHASRYTVRVGQRVSRGQVIGYVGNTGYSTGCHLHLMVWLDGRVANPMSWF